MKSRARKIYFIDRKFQMQFIIKFCLLVVLSSLITAGLLYAFASKTTTVSFENTEAVVKSTADFIVPVLVQTIIVVMVLMGLFTIMLTLFISHKIAGPLYRLQKEFEIMSKGDLSSEFKLRGDDQLQSIAESLNDMKSRLRFYFNSFSSNIKELESILEENVGEEDVKKLVIAKLEKTKNSLNSFKF